MSSPSPPLIVSLPAEPIKIFAEESPVIVSLYLEPTIFSKLAALPFEEPERSIVIAASVRKLLPMLPSGRPKFKVSEPAPPSNTE